MQTTAKRRIFGWMMFDAASQPFYTLCLTFVFGPYFTGVLADAYLAAGQAEGAADAQAQTVWSWTQSLIGLSIALSAPILGAMADRSSNRMTWVTAFSVLYVIGTFGLWYMVPDASNTTFVLLAFAIAMIGAEFTTIFTNSMLPGLAPMEDTGRISGTGYAMGYLGGFVALIIMLVLFTDNSDGTTLFGGSPALGLDGMEREGTRAVGPFTALWYIVFMVPFFIFVREPKQAPQKISVGIAIQDVVTLLKSIPGRKSLAFWLLGSMLYRDALAALYAFGGVYARLVLDWETTQIGIFGIAGLVVAIVACWIGGRLDGRYGPKPVIVGSVLILVSVVIVLCGMSRTHFFGVELAEGSTLPDTMFYIMGAVIGGAGGVVQAASRTMMVRHADPEKPSEAFGLYALSGKATAFLAPALIGFATWMTGSAQLGIFPVAILFLLGLFLLRWVNPNGDQT